MYLDLIVIRHVIGFKQLIFVTKSKGHKQKAFQTDDMEINYNFAKLYHVLCLNCAIGIIFELVTVLNVIIFLFICHLLSSITR